MKVHNRLFPFACGALMASLAPTPSIAAPASVNGNPHWVRVPLITADSRHDGVSIGGEGGQAIRCIEVAKSDPNFLMVGTDVGGIYRSLDGGKLWQVCMVGWKARGGNGFAIDPKNPRRVLGFGANSSDWNPNFGTSPNGIYLSTDEGASWSQVMPSLEGDEWRNNILKFDPSSYDRSKGYCTVAYCLSRDTGLYKSTDGGVTWSHVNKSIGGGQLQVQPAKGWLYVGLSGDKDRGLYRSRDGGVTFDKLNDLSAECVEVVPTHPDWVWIAGSDGVQVSHDDGETFQSAGAGTGMQPGALIRNLRVSPVNPLYVMANHGGKQWWESYMYWSHDGGKTWTSLDYSKTNHFLPITQAGNRFQFSPVDPKVAYSDTATGCVMKSVDGGEHFVWSNNGLNDVMGGASFNFSASHPSQVFLSFQDFDAAISHDDGYTWTYLNPAGNPWGGYEYGGTTSDGSTVWTGDAQGWTQPRTLKVSFDGGTTWAVAKDHKGADIHFEGADVCYTDPTNDKILFASNWRSTDGGHNWQRMTGVDGVFISSPAADKALIGRHGHAVARSIDHGSTWTDVTPALDGDIKDVAYDHVRNRYYAAANDKVYASDGKAWTPLDLAKDSTGGTHAWTVAVDPVDPSMVYAAGPSNIFANDCSVSASIDAGKTWFNLTVTRPLSSATAPGGPHEVTWVRVDPKTRALWAQGECYGFWKISVKSVESFAHALNVK